MNHDITHCYGCSTTIDGTRLVPDSTQPCPLRNRCNRYIAAVEAAQLQLPDVTYRLGSVSDCNLFWPIDD